ncbi:hypothetical protein LTR36_000585 [Oleoguttula mirabilis]|uniref:Cytochrome P450 n=1 Tax=Oleoguttula mirabilis TaxID=1507867 RepID=A0AAV9JQC6_9PEZI|nr:hypothetical protein LTR36_000585 [Oleoguttula mirabilis]
MFQQALDLLAGQASGPANLAIGAAGALVLLYALVTVAQSTYRLYLSPLARFPGPRAAAVSRAWLHQTMKDPFPEAIFERLHEEYGTKALRIGPNQLHLSDTTLYKTIYSQTTNYTKQIEFYDSFLTPHTLFAETEPALHKLRRKALNPFFSTAGVAKLEPIITEKIDLFKAKIDRLSARGPINVSLAMRCITIDVISQFAFGKSRDLIHEREDSFEAELLNAVDEAGKALPDMTFNNIMRKMALRMPESLVLKLNPGLTPLFKLKEFANDSVATYHAMQSKPSHPVVYGSLEHLSAADQAQEGVDILVAGADTTAYTASIALYHILRDSRIQSKLQTALADAKITTADGMPHLRELEKIDYLRACVKEALRIAMPVPGMLPRAIVGMSAYTMHNDTETWGSDARNFVPERWLGTDSKSLELNMCTFSKGARQCIGMNVATAELHMLLAHLFTQYKMTLETKKLTRTDLFVLTSPDGIWIRFERK